MLGRLSPFLRWHFFNWQSSLIFISIALLNIQNTFNIPRSLIWSSHKMPFFSRFEDKLQSLSTLWMLISRNFCGRSYVLQTFGSEQLDTSKHTIPDSCHHFLLGLTRACLGSLKQGWLADCHHIWWCELNISLCNPTEKNRTKENPGFSLDFADFL